VVITAPDPDWLLGLTRELVTEGLCASVHNFSPVKSIYRWRGKIFERTEGRASLRLMNQPPQPVAPDNRSGGSVADELRKLSELRDAGVLTNAEFNAQKARLLGS
jgi:hypothetical protein